MKLIYIAGPYRANTEVDTLLNIRNAEIAAIKIWSLGHVAICPHKNSAFFGGAASDATFLHGAIELMKRCDAVFLAAYKFEPFKSLEPEAVWSKGTLDEVRIAANSNIPVFDELPQLHKWLDNCHLSEM